MKDLIFITAHCTEKEQIESLDRCVNSLIKSKYHIAIISHTHIPSYIQKKCHYYFYDYLNEISENPDLLSSLDFDFQDKTILRSKFFHKYFYGFAIYRMFSIASNIAKVFGYKNIHHIEYDCQILDVGLIEKHSKLLEEYDSVCYTTNGEFDGRFFGSFKSFKVETLPRLFTNYDRDHMENYIVNSDVKILEFFTKNLLNDNGRVCFLNINELSKDKFVFGKDFYNRNLHYTFFYDEKTETVNIFYRCTKENGENITVIINDNKVLNFKINKDYWVIRTLGKLDEVKNIRIDNGDKIIYKKEFDSIFKENLKKYSYIIDEKDN
jgi:hypothetical protein